MSQVKGMNIRRTKKVISSDNEITFKNIKIIGSTISGQTSIHLHQNVLQFVCKHLSKVLHAMKP